MPPPQNRCTFVGRRPLNMHEDTADAGINRAAYSEFGTMRPDRSLSRNPHRGNSPRPSLHDRTQDLQRSKALLSINTSSKIKPYSGVTSFVGVLVAGQRRRQGAMKRHEHVVDGLHSYTQQSLRYATKPRLQEGCPRSLPTYPPPSSTVLRTVDIQPQPARSWLS